MNRKAPRCVLKNSELYHESPLSVPKTPNCTKKPPKCTNPPKKYTPPKCTEKPQGGVLTHFGGFFGTIYAQGFLGTFCDFLGGFLGTKWGGGVGIHQGGLHAVQPAKSVREAWGAHHTKEALPSW